MRRITITFPTVIIGQAPPGPYEFLYGEDIFMIRGNMYFTPNKTMTDLPKEYYRDNKVVINLDTVLTFSITKL